MGFWKERNEVLERNLCMKGISQDLRSQNGPKQTYNGLKPLFRGGASGTNWDSGKKETRNEASALTPPFWDPISDPFGIRFALRKRY